MYRFFAIAAFIVSLCINISSAHALELDMRKGRIINLPRPAAHVFIADPEIADIDVRSPNYIYVYGLSVGETTIHALDANHKTVFEDTIVVGAGTQAFEDSIRKILPDSNITFQSIGSGVVVKGNVNSPKDADLVVQLASSLLGSEQNLINMLEVRGSDQVMLRVRVAEVARSEIKNFGINLSSIMTKGTFSFGLFTGRDFLDATAALTRQGNNIRLQGQPGRFTIDSVIDALESEGLVTTLAEPNLTAKSGEAASFLAGGEFPIPIPQEGGVTAIEYREFGVGLDFTPTVLANDKISLAVAPQVSSLTASAVTIAGNNIPTLSTRRASTTVELGSGESFAIAGLLRNDVTNDISKFPWLGDIPVLGTLFRSNNFRNDETELVIIVTPYIVNGVAEADKLLTPTEGYEVPSDFERILFGKLYIEQPLGREAGEYEGKIAEYRLHGEPGFILEE